MECQQQFDFPLHSGLFDYPQKNYYQNLYNEFQPKPFYENNQVGLQIPQFIKPQQQFEEKAQQPDNFRYNTNFNIQKFAFTNPMNQIQYLMNNSDMALNQCNNQFNMINKCNSQINQFLGNETNLLRISKQESAFDKYFDLEDDLLGEQLQNDDFELFQHMNPILPTEPNLFQVKQENLINREQQYIELHQKLFENNGNNMNQTSSETSRIEKNRIEMKDNSQTLEDFLSNEQDYMEKKMLTCQRQTFKLQNVQRKLIVKVPKKASSHLSFFSKKLESIKEDYQTQQIYHKKVKNNNKFFFKRFINLMKNHKPKLLERYCNKYQIDVNMFKENLNADKIESVKQVKELWRNKQQMKKIGKIFENYCIQFLNDSNEIKLAIQSKKPIEEKILYVMSIRKIVKKLQKQ